MLKVISGNEIDNIEKGVIKFPEAGKHPDEIFKNAKQLVWASKFFDIKIITYSPLLIESIDVWADYLKINVTFYLNKEEISQNELYKVYSNLAKAYDKIDILRLGIKRR